ncbi:MAG: hypothetical protein EHM42_06880 [Planctomycetaceae bacterium]|nr:MAG: hypothetical protein EHM42_06880 [Planctomycetaceae bacterium]
MKVFVYALLTLSVLAAGWLGWQVFGPSRAAATPTVERCVEITFICTETGALSRGPRVETPALNPALGRATLVQALYCPKCQKWVPMPPAAVLERMPLGPVCLEHRTALLETAPAGSPGEVLR